MDKKDCEIDICSFTSIMWAAFVPISFWLQITNQKRKDRKAPHNTVV